MSSAPPAGIVIGQPNVGTTQTYYGRFPSNVFGQLGPATSELTLMGGMTAGYGVNDGNYDNPLLPGGAQDVAGVQPYGGNPNWPTKRVGVMRNVPWTVPVPANDDGTWPGFYSLYFLYNPNQIQVSFQTNPSQIPPIYLYGAGGSNPSFTGNGINGNVFGTPAQPTSDANSSDTNNPIIPNLMQNQSVSWSLLFDRTYDMMYDTKPAQNRGVLKDVAALYNLMGTFDSSGAVPVSTPIQCVFAQTGSGQLWGFTGFITSVQITYGIFRYDMIPSRCQVDLQMMMTYVAPQAPSAPAGPGFVNPNVPPSILNPATPSNPNFQGPPTPTASQTLTSPITSLAPNLTPSR